MSIKILTWLSTFFIIVLAELGDKTQVAVLLITSRNPEYKWVIYFGCALALVLCVTLEVTIGVTLARYLGPSAVNRIAGIFFILMGLTSLARLARTDSDAVLEN